MNLDDSGTTPKSSILESYERSVSILWATAGEILVDSAMKKLLGTSLGAGLRRLAMQPEGKEVAALMLAHAGCRIIGDAACKGSEGIMMQ